MTDVLEQLLNGLSYSVLLFLLAVGLTLIFGMLRVVNLAHGSFYMLGAYAGIATISVTKSLWAAMLVAPLAVAAIGALVERTCLRPLYRRGQLDQVLLTFGLVYVFEDLTKAFWGGRIRSIRPPPQLEGALHFSSITFPSYRLFVIGVGLFLAVALWLLIERTRIGAIVRAAVYDPGMASAMGIDVSKVFAATFAAGAGLAGFAGVIAGPMQSAQPSMGGAVLVPALIVVVVGGLGSLRGSMVGSLILGQADTFGRVWLPSASMSIMYMCVVLVLLVRPQGLFGTAHR